ncbi:MAG: CoA transferase, partial [Pseudomonadales bacterium]|nr:CoA transferase [Pseudomonadales bacterium]
FGGGALYLAMGVLAGVIEAQKSGKGQVVDCAMTDGSASLMAMFYGMKGMGRWSEERGTNMIDGGSHFYTVYKTKDDNYISVGSIEPKFYQELLEKSGLAEDASLPKQLDESGWAIMKEKLTAIFLSKTRTEWCDIMEGSDVCFAPILNMEESINHPHNVDRNTFVEIGGIMQPAPAPRFDRTPSDIPKPSSAPGEDTVAVLSDWGFDDKEIQGLKDSKAIMQS